MENNLNLLRFWRMKRGLTLEELAEKSGINRDTISRMEHGRKARPSSIGRLANALEVEPDILETLLVSEPPKRKRPGETLAALTVN